jgi:hypothetical protein
MVVLTGLDAPVPESVFVEGRLTNPRADPELGHLSLKAVLDTPCELTTGTYWPQLHDHRYCGGFDNSG